MSKAPQRSTLGRGLDALISTDYVSGKEVETEGSSSINEIPLANITPNKEQPRTDFDEETLRELADSIRHIGLVQPITVYELEEQPGHYRIISGERRYRAAQLAQLETLPAYIRTAADEQVMEMALIENIQREDLNAIEIALAFKKLMDNYSLTQEQLSDRVGKKRATIANYLRLLRLPAEIQMALKDAKISMGHARALLGVDDPELQLAFYEQVVKDSLSVRQVEQMIRDYLSGSDEPKSKKTAKQRSTNSEYDLLSRRFSDLFKTKVSMKVNENGKGRILIPFESPQQLEEIIAMLDKL